MEILAFPQLSNNSPVLRAGGFVAEQVSDTQIVNVRDNSLGQVTKGLVTRLVSKSSTAIGPAPNGGLVIFVTPKEFQLELPP